MEVVVSAQGKVLITEGYIVLQRPNAGLVLSSSARFYAIVKPLYEELKPESWAWLRPFFLDNDMIFLAWPDVKLTSPQLQKEASYKLSLKHSTLQCTSSRDFRNPFIEQAVQYVVAASKVLATYKEKHDQLHKLLLQGLDITILGCNDFYSFRHHIEARGLPLTTDALASIPQFCSVAFNLEEPSKGTDQAEASKPEVAKTGLGSSAAMTTAVVAAILHHLGIVNLPFPAESSPHPKATHSDLDLIHSLAQTAHCIAQGKIGSGFDVSAAVYGSQHYIRFSPRLLSSAQEIGGMTLDHAVSALLKEKWDHEKSHFSLPPLMTLLLGEPGSGGSSTPSMVGSVNKWKKSDPHKSQDIWRKIADANSMVETQLRNLSKLAEEQREAYNFIIESCSANTYERWPSLVTDQYQDSVVKSLLGARNAFLEIRANMRAMGSAAGVPIEPESQTRLLDATMNLEGVLLAGVPGAGGFDAVFAIIIGDMSNSVIQTWSSFGTLPLLVREDPRGVSLESGDPRAKEVSSGISSLQIN